MITEIELVPGVKGESVFKSLEEYEDFRRRWHENVVPQLEKFEEAHRRSVEDSFHRPPLRLAA